MSTPCFAASLLRALPVLCLSRLILCLFFQLLCIPQGNQSEQRTRLDGRAIDQWKWHTALRPRVYSAQDQLDQAGVVLSHGDLGCCKSAFRFDSWIRPCIQKQFANECIVPISSDHQSCVVRIRLLAVKILMIRFDEHFHTSRMRLICSVMQTCSAEKPKKTQIKQPAITLSQRTWEGRG